MPSRFWKVVILTAPAAQLPGVRGFLAKKGFSLRYGAKSGSVIRREKILQLLEMRWGILPMRLSQSIL